MLGRAGRLTPGGLRAAIAQAVMEVNAEKARQRREAAAKKARVERWPEFSGNAALGGRELPPVQVLAADQRIQARAGQLKAAGLEGSMDELRARDLAAAAARNPATTWCITVTDQDGHAIGHGCARRPARGGRPGGAGNRDGPGVTFTPSGRDGPPGGYGSWQLRTGQNGPDLTIGLDPFPAGDCDHRFQAKGHDPGVKLRHLTEVRHAACTSPACRRPASQCDFEHNTPYEAGGRTCMCNGGPKCRRHHRLKQHPRWKAEQLADGTFLWTGPSGRTYPAEPTRYPI